MSTYLISDIHGALEPFMILLSEIGFDPSSGKDELYLLGDYADWGSHSIETIGYVMDLDQSPHVHCLIGNHDLMFLQSITEDRDMRFPDLVWYEMNKGYKTWDDYEKLSDNNKKAISEWLRSLSFSIDIEANGRLYMAAHAYPYFGNRGKLGQIYTKNEAVWHRAGFDEDPFVHYHGKKKYSALIIGHTPTSYFHYCRAGRAIDGPNTVFFGRKIIAIDCGAKALEYPEFGRECDNARLAALRLEDEKCFYMR
ncbi:MAG: metallophosphoesterase [Lachnospiraceae bacterium]|nr:metallophosphoesterase [Lachnospiraceae bacterium]